MELEIVTEKEAEEKPTAVARDEPNAYPKLDKHKYVYNNSYAYPKLPLWRKVLAG